MHVAGTDLCVSLQRISLRQNLLSTLFYHPLPPPAAGHALNETATDSADATARDAVDEDPHDDDDAAKKEADFPYHEQQRAEKEEPVWPLRDLKELEEVDLYDNSLKSIKGLEGLDSLECASFHSHDV